MTNTVCLDTETTGVDFHHGAKPYLVTISASYEDSPVSWMWDVDPKTRNPTVDPDDLDDIQEYLDSADVVVCHNAKFDCRAMKTVMPEGWEWPWSKTKDTMVAGHLLGSKLPHNLTDMVKMYLHDDIQHFEDDIEKCTKECRRLINRKRSPMKGWRVAKAGLPEMPSAKDKTWKFDMWLPKAVATFLKFNPDHHYHFTLRKYATADSAYTLALWKVLSKLIDHHELSALFNEKMKLTPILAEMEDGGMTFSKSRLDALYDEYSTEVTKLTSICQSIVYSFDKTFKMPKSVQGNNLNAFVFDTMKVKGVRGHKSKTDKPSLDKPSREYYLASLDKKSRQYKFIHSLHTRSSRVTSLTFMASYRKFSLPTESPDHFVLYPNLNQIGTDTTRLSSSNPNQQNISKKGVDVPCKDCEGRGYRADGDCPKCKGNGMVPMTVRYVFGPLPGYEWYSIDYENLELRIPAYAANERAMIELFESPGKPPYFGSYHLLIAHILHKEKFEECLKMGVRFNEHPATKPLYGRTKNGNFAVQYGAQPESGTADRAYGIIGAQKIVQSHLKAISAYSQKIIEFAKIHGYVETMPAAGRKRGYPLMCTFTEWGKILPTVPLSYHIQGTAGECAHRAMLRCDAQLKKWSKEYKKPHRMIMNVHDELGFCLPIIKGESNQWKAEKLKQLMELSGDDIGIPLKASVSHHPNNWSDAA